MSRNADSKRGAWASARRLAERTPPERNRYADFLRAVSILAVVVGHWLIAAPYIAPDGEVSLGHMLGISPWTQWLTWGFQVMPVFFMVGGYSNAASWASALRANRSYATWLFARLRRLVGPVLVLVAVWVALGIAAHLGGVAQGTIKIGSQAALVPTWFLAVYVLVAVFVPPTHAAWRRFGLGSFAGLALAAVLVDVASLAGGMRWLGWLNYLFVWLAVHQLGYAWREGKLSGPRRALPWAVGGLALLWGLIAVAGYPRSMVGVPGEEVSNTLPPTLAMLGLGAAQCGLLLSIEGPMRRVLDGLTAWTATVLINSMIMTIYLWHLTVMVVYVSASVVLGGAGLHLEPGSSAWWATRPVWMVLLALGLLPLIVAFGRFERPSPADANASCAAWRLIAGAAMVCGGLALMALGGVAGGGPLGLRWAVVLLPFAGALVAGMGGGRHSRPA